MSHRFNPLFNLSRWLNRRNELARRGGTQHMMASLEALESRMMLSVTLQILHASDLEGGADAIVDAPNFAAVVEGLEADAASQGIASVLISSGDNYLPGPFFSAGADSTLRTPLRNALGNPDAREGAGRVDIGIMNIIGFDASALGNHEFDPTTTVLREAIGTDIRDGNGDSVLDDSRWLGADFPYLSSNLDFSNDPNLSGLYADEILPNTAFKGSLDDLAGAAAAPKLASATVIDIGGGELIGVVGATTPLLDAISSPGLTDVKNPGAGTNDMELLATHIQPVIDQLILQGVDRIVLTSHLQQIALEQELATLLTGVDVILAGGSDTRLADETDRLRSGDEADGAYPIITQDAQGSPVAIVSTDGQYSYVGRLVVEFDDNGQIVTSSIDANVSGVYATDAQGVTDVWADALPGQDPFAEGSKGARVKVLTDAVQGVVIEADSQVYGQATVFINGRRSDVRTEETNFGNLSADANLAAAREVDPTVMVSIKNGGGIRDSIGQIDGDTGEQLPPQANPLSGKLDGQVSQLDIENTLRFNNSLTILSLTADGLKQIMEHAVAASGEGNTPGQFAQVGGMKFSYDLSKPAGDRVRSLAIVDDAGDVVDVVVQDGEVIGNASRDIRVVTLGFMADGGDSYPFPALLSNRNDTGLGEQVALSDYLTANFPVGSNLAFAEADTPQALDQRIQNLAIRTDTVVSDEMFKFLGTYATGAFDEAAAEILAHDPETQRVFFVNADEGTIGVLDISDVNNPKLINTIDVNELDSVETGGPNSVAIKNGLVAVAVEADDATDPGFVAFFDIDGNLLNVVGVGSLPDMVTFTPDGMKVLVANEGEPDGDLGGVDPDGSVSIIDLSNGVANATVTTATFAAFNGRENELRNRGVRIFPGKNASADLEPEYIAVSPDGTTAFVTLQEASAFGVLNIATGTIVDILPMGLKDYSKGLPTVESITFTDLPLIANGDSVTLLTPAGQTVELGGFSALDYVGVNPENGNLQFITVPDRGPNPETFNQDMNDDGVPEVVRPFALPDYQARLVAFEYNESTGEITITNQIFLSRVVGEEALPITGLSNVVFDSEGNQIDEFPIDLEGNPIAVDPFGGDFEGLVVASDGTYWLNDEYRPAIYHFDAQGVLINRFVPAGTAAAAGLPEGTFGTETLPAEYALRRANRGFEAIALNKDTGVLYSFIQTPLANPTTAASNASDVIRILGIDTATGTVVEEYVYILEDPAFRDSKVDKIGDATWIGGTKFLVTDRDSATTATGKKPIFEIDLAYATNLQTPGATDDLIDGKTLEQHSADELIAAGITPVSKLKVTNLPSIGYVAGDKVEGIVQLPDGRIVVLNDNDFKLAVAPVFELNEVTGMFEPIDGGVVFQDNPTEPVLGIVSFSQPNGLDASDRDDAINITNWPVFGMFMPDTISSFEIDGATYYITANEGDDRGDFGDDDLGDAIRLDDLDLDPGVFPNAEALLENEALGRLTVSALDGDLDGDGDIDRIHTYGARSFSIWDSRGNLVWDSGSALEQITADALPEYFNASNDNTNFDNRSDNKGPEAEAVTTGVIDGVTYAFVGLERVGGVMVWNVSNPLAPQFVQYFNNRNFAADVESAEALDSAPEDIKFVAAADSPTGAPLLLVSNEVSGTVTIYGLDAISTGGGDLVVSGPDLDSTLVIPGLKATLDLTASNIGNAELDGTAVFNVWLSKDGNLNAGDILIGSSRQKVDIDAGQTLDVSVKVQVPSDIDLGDYVLIVDADADNDVAEGNEFNNLFVSPTLTIGQFAGEVDGTTVKSFKTTIDGVAVQLSVSGPGTAELFEDGNGLNVYVTGSTDATKVTLKASKGAIDINNFTVVGDAQSIQLKGVELTGTLSVGSIEKLDLDIVSDDARLVIGEGVDADTTVQIKAKTVEDLSITSLMPISKLDVEAWLNTNAVLDSITAPWIERLGSKGDFMASIQLTGENGDGFSLERFDAKGLVSGVEIRTVGSIDRVNVAGIHDSLVLVGVDSDVVGQVAGVADFVNPDAFIGEFRVSGGKSITEPSFRNTTVAAAMFERIRLKDVQDNNGGVTHGFGSTLIERFERSGLKLTDLATAGVDDDASLGDFEVELFA